MAVSTIDALYHSGSEKLTTTGTGITVTGTVAATAYTGDGSALTGTGSPSIVDNGNATAITIDSSENVGIGTSSPNAPLTVIGGTNTAPSIQLKGGAYANDNASIQSLYSLKLKADSSESIAGRTISFDVGTTNAMRIDSTGAVTKPNQPAFHVTKGTNQSPIGSTINVEYTVVWASEKYDIGGNFSGSQFTAPIAGKYVFQAQTMLTGTETQGNYYWMRINTSNGNIGEIQSIKYASNPTYLSLGSHCIVDMDVGDTAWVGVRYGSVVGSNPDIVVDDAWTWFMGYLLG